MLWIQMVFCPTSWGQRTLLRNVLPLPPGAVALHRCCEVDKVYAALSQWLET